MEDDLLVPALRFIGNACADTGLPMSTPKGTYLTPMVDVNREIAIDPEYIQPMIGHLDNDEVAGVAVSVIYNICNNNGESLFQDISLPS